jgi:hypothetical protein
MPRRLECMRTTRSSRRTVSINTSTNSRSSFCRATPAQSASARNQPTPAGAAARVRMALAAAAALRPRSSCSRTLPARRITYTICTRKRCTQRTRSPRAARAGARRLRTANSSSTRSHGSKWRLAQAACTRRARWRSGRLAQMVVLAVRRRRLTVAFEPLRGIRTGPTLSPASGNGDQRQYGLRREPDFGPRRCVCTSSKCATHPSHPDSLGPLHKSPHLGHRPQIMAANTQLFESASAIGPKRRSAAAA